jgi:hypothetical protein
LSPIATPMKTTYIPAILTSIIVLPKAKKTCDCYPHIGNWNIHALLSVVDVHVLLLWFSGARVQYQGLGVLHNTSLRLWQEPKIQ